MVYYWCSELHKDVELKRFIAQLRKEILTGPGGGATSEEEGIIFLQDILMHALTIIILLFVHTYYVADKVLNDIGRDLKQSGLYFKYMQEKGPDE